MKSKCMDIVNQLDAEDSESILSKLAQYQGMGVPADRAQKMAVKDVMEEVKAEHADFMKLVREQHPDAPEMIASGASNTRAAEGIAKSQVDTPAFKKWFKDSKVVDADGKPLVVYRGEHGESNEQFQTRGSLTFSANPDTASLYAEAPNDYRDEAKAPRVIPVYLAIKNPFFNDSDPFIDLQHIKDKLGNPAMIEAAKEFSHNIESTSKWDEDYSGKYESASDAIDGGVSPNELYFELYNMLDSTDWVERIKAAGFDGAIYDGSGESAQEKEYRVFDTKNIKSAIGNNGQFDAASPDIRFSNRTEQSKQFKAWSRGAPVVRLGDTHEFRSGQPIVVEALHGTTSDSITVFDRSKSNIESDFGAGFYGSNNQDDVAANYANEHGPDLTMKIERLAEDLESDDEFEGDHGEAVRRARAQLSGAAPNTMKLYMRFNNPAVVGGKHETYLDYQDAYDEEADEYGEPTGKLVDLIEALRDIGPDYAASDRDIQDAIDKLLDNAEGDGVKLSSAVRIIKENLMDASDDEGNSASSEVVRQVIEHLGFDGIVDLTVHDKFGKKIVRNGMKLDRAGGMDGITEGTIHFIAFSPSQIKSAIGNNGNFDGGKKEIHFANKGGWEAPEATGFDNLVYKMQDKMVDVKRVIEAIGKVAPVSEDQNVYRQEELFHGRAAKRTHDFANEELKPLIQGMKADGVSMADLEEYLHARHAQEANALIASRDGGMSDGGSGMTDAAAAGYLAALDPVQKTKFESAAKRVDAILAKTRQLYADYGLEGQDTVNGWQGMFKHYVPLQREQEGDTHGMGIGQGFSVKGKEVKSRTGSTRKVVDIMANIAMQRERLIVRGEKNRVSQALLGLAIDNPNKDFWTVGTPPAERVYDAKTNSIVSRIDPMYKSRDNVMVAKVRQPDGSVKEVGVVFNEDNARAMRMVTSLKNMDAGQLEGLLGVSAKITRYFSSINTQYNPVFGVVNLIRDVQSAMITLDRTPLAKKKARIAKDTISALSGIYSDMRAERQGKHPTSQWAQLWEEFQKEGGQTGYRQMFATSTDRANELARELNPDAWLEGKYSKIFTANGALKVPLSQAKKGAAIIFDWLSDYNESMENGVRLATYKAGLDQGMSKQEAASLAKNLTVNFNRKGQIGQQAGAVYAFFNAAMQGSANIARTVFTMEDGDLKTVRLSATGKKVVYGGMLLGSMQALALAAAGFGDDDPPEFVRSKSLIIPTGLVTGGKTYLSIPMPQGFNVIPGLGRSLTEFALGGFKDPAKRSIGIVSLFADSFNPIGNAGMSMQTIAPTALDPFVALTENKDFTGKPIARISSNKAIPGHTQFKDSATVIGKLVAEAINGVTGGNAYVAGAISPTPDQIDYLLGQVTGGVGRELSKVEQSSIGVATGETVPIHKVPLLGRFIGNAESQASQSGQFYGNANRLNELETEVKGLRKDGKTQEANELMKAHPEAYMIAQVNVAERQVQRLRKEKRALVESGASREAVKAKEDQITATMTRLNQAMERVAVH